MSKIVLIKTAPEKILQGQWYHMPLLNLGYLAAVLEQKGVDVRVIDAQFESLGLAKTVERARKAGAKMMFGTSAFLWFKENKITRLTFQIIKNKIAAEISLKKLEEILIEFGEIPTSSEQSIITWETENQKFIIEYPKRIHGYIHLMK